MFSQTDRQPIYLYISTGNSLNSCLSNSTYPMESIEEEPCRPLADSATTVFMPREVEPLRDVGIGRYSPGVAWFSSLPSGRLQ